MKIDNQIVELKSEGHPDQLADILSETAVNAIHEHNDELYVNLDNCYLKAGRFPEFILGGQMSFDFNIYSKEDRWDLEKFVTNKIIDEFKEVFPDAKIDVSFQISLYPNPKENLAFRGMHDQSSYITAFFPFTDYEAEVKAIDKYLSEEVEYCGSDYRILRLPDDIVVEACFFENNASLSTQLQEELKGEFPNISNIENLVVNPEQSITGTKYNRFGSTLFNNESGVTGRGNDLYGFRSPQRPNNTRNIRGKDNRSSDKLLFREAFNVAKDHYKNHDEPINVTAFSIAGEEKDDVEYIANTNI